MTLALSGIAWAVFTLFTGGVANAEYGIYR